MCIGKYLSYHRIIFAFQAYVQFLNPSTIWMAMAVTLCRTIRTNVTKIALANLWFDAMSMHTSVWANGDTRSVGSLESTFTLTAVTFFKIDTLFRFWITSMMAVGTFVLRSAFQIMPFWMIWTLAGLGHGICGKTYTFPILPFNCAPSKINARSHANPKRCTNCHWWGDPSYPHEGFSKHELHDRRVVHALGQILGDPLRIGPQIPPKQSSGEYAGDMHRCWLTLQ